MDKQFEPLASGEVLSVDQSVQLLLGQTTFRASELAAALKGVVLAKTQGSPAQGDWFSDQGVACEALRFGARGWQRGRVRIRLEFHPESEELQPDAQAQTVPEPAIASPPIAIGTPAPDTSEDWLEPVEPPAPEPPVSDPFELVEDELEPSSEPEFSADEVEEVFEDAPPPHFELDDAEDDELEGVFDDTDAEVGDIFDGAPEPDLGLVEIPEEDEDASLLLGDDDEDEDEDTDDFDLVGAADDETEDVFGDIPEEEDSSGTTEAAVAEGSDDFLGLEEGDGEDLFAVTAEDEAEDDLFAATEAAEEDDAFFGMAGEEASEGFLGSAVEEDEGEDLFSLGGDVATSRDDTDDIFAAAEEEDELLLESNGGAGAELAATADDDDDIFGTGEGIDFDLGDALTDELSLGRGDPEANGKDEEDVFEDIWQDIDD